VQANHTLLNLALRETGQTPAERIFSRQNPKQQNYTVENSKQLIGRGSFGSMTFPEGVNRTFIMNLTISYTPSPDRGALNDPAMNEIIQLCVDNDTRFGRRTTLIGYEAFTDIKPLSSLGLAPKFDGSIRINCPFQGSAREELLSALKGGARTGSAEGTLPTTNTGTNLRKLKNSLYKSPYQQPFAIIEPDMIEFV
jgi:hypothetical protein